MGSSLGFGSIQCNLSPISDSLSLRLHLFGLTLLHRITRWLIKQKARGLAVDLADNIAIPLLVNI
jgi:hypothetical protein